MPKSKASESLKEEFQSLKEDVASLAKTLKELSQENIGSAKDKLKAKSQSTIEELRREFENYKGEGKHLIQNLNDEIKANPVASLVIACGVGFLLAKLIGRGK